MASDLVVGPMEHRIDSDMATGLAHPELLLNPISVKRRAHNLFRGPVVIVGHNYVLSHHCLDGAELGSVLPKAHNGIRTEAGSICD